MFTGLNYQYSTAVSFISATSYGGGATAAWSYSRWYKNGVLLQPVTNYIVGFSQYRVNVIHGLTPFNTGDVIRLELYNTVQDRLVAGINNGNGTLLEFDEATVTPRYSYLETYAPNANSILSTDTIDQSVIQQTPLVVPKCTTTPINAHIISTITIVNNRVDDGASYTHGQFILNGANVANADIDEQALETGTFNFSAGAFTHNAKNIQLNIKSTLASNTITYQHNGIDTAADFTFSINNIGFSKISSDAQLTRYCFAGEDVGTYPQFATATSLYSVEQTPTQYILRVDGVIVRTINRSVVYSSTIGSVSNGSVLPINTSVNFISNNHGSGYIQALIDNSIIARQAVNTSQISAPVFAGGYTFANVCPNSTFDLASLTPTNLPVGYSLKWYTTSGLVTELSSLIISTTSTIWASFESDTATACNGFAVAIVVNITTCIFPDATNHNYTAIVNTPINGNVSTDNTDCDTQVTSYRLQGNPSNTLPYVTVHGQVTVFNQTTGAFTWQPNLNLIGIFINEITYNLLCNNSIVDTAFESFEISIPSANAVNDSTTTPINTEVELDLSTNDVDCSEGTTSWEINTQSVNGVATIDSNTGVLTFNPTTGFYGITTGTYNILCNGVVIDTATWTIAVIAPSITVDITNSTNALPNLEVTCGDTNLYKENLIITPNTVVSPITRVWTVGTGATILGSSTDETVIVQTNVGFVGNYNLTLTVTTPIGIFVDSIEINSICPIEITPVPIIETICIESVNSIIKGLTIPNSIVYLYNENTALLTQVTADALGNFTIYMEYWYNFGRAFLLKTEAPNMQKSDYSPFIIKCSVVCCTPKKKKSKC